MKFAAVILLALLATACNKPEMHNLEGTWQWTRTSGGIAGVNYTLKVKVSRPKSYSKATDSPFTKMGKRSHLVRITSIMT